MALATIFATLIILLVFLPIFGLTGIEGRLLQPLALAYGVSLLASLAVALTLTPALSYDLLSRKPEDVGKETKMGRPYEGLVPRFEATLAEDRRDREELVSALRGAVGAVPGVQAIFGQPIGHRIDHILSGARANIAIKVFAPDTDTLQTTSTQVETAVSAIPGAVDVQKDTQSRVPYLRVRVRRADLANHGLSVEDVTGAIQAAIAGAEVGQLVERPVITDVVVRYDPAQYNDAGQMENMLLATRNGQVLPLAAVADVVRDQGPNAITRESVERMQLVMANVSGRDLGAVVAEVETALEGIDLPPGSHIELGGQFESAGSATRTLLALGLIVLTVCSCCCGRLSGPPTMPRSSCSTCRWRWSAAWSASG